MRFALAPLYPTLIIVPLGMTLNLSLLRKTVPENGNLQAISNIKKKLLKVFFFYTNSPIGQSTSKR